MHILHKFVLKLNKCLVIMYNAFGILLSFYPPPHIFISCYFIWTYYKHSCYGHEGLYNINTSRALLHSETRSQVTKPQEIETLFHIQNCSQSSFSSLPRSVEQPEYCVSHVWDPSCCWATLDIKTASGV